MDNNSQICINEEQEPNEVKEQQMCQTPIPNNILGELAQADQENNFFNVQQEEQKANAGGLLELSEIQLD